MKSQKKKKKKKMELKSFEKSKMSELTQCQCHTMSMLGNLRI